MSPKGVHIEKGEPVERMSNEGPLDQNLGISIDDNHKSLVFLDSVTDENDVFDRCPVIGQIDGDKAGGGGKSIKKVLDETPYAAQEIYLNPSGEGLAELGAGPVVDRFAVGDANWIDNTQDLIWKSALLAQLQAKHNAVTHFVTDPAVADFAKKMSAEDKKIVAQRARQLAAELQDAALSEISGAVNEAGDRLKESVTKTKQRFLRYVVTQEDAIKEGGLTESEVNELFEEER
jgi:hypothetical protein